VSELVKRNQIGSPKILIIGGIAGGASCAARARRLSEDAEIIVFERGKHVSFASCGLPYYVGDIIPKEKDLLVATPELFRQRFNIDVRVLHEVTKIDRSKQIVEVQDLHTGKVYHENYDSLVLSPGSVPLRPPIPGIDLPGIFTLRNLKDGQLIKKWITEKQVKNAVIVGGGFIGLETLENLVRRDISVTIIEMLPQLLPSIDPEIAALIEAHLVEKGVALHLGDSVVKFEPLKSGEKLHVTTGSGNCFDCGMVLLATGVRPETGLAKQAGLEIGNLGGIRVDDHMQTGDPKIWAVGDAVETRNFITGKWCLVPLAGPASRQGRIAADSIFGRDVRFRGVQGTTVCEVLGITIAATGLNEKTLNEAGSRWSYEKVYLNPGHHANYYPGAKAITLKLLYSQEDGKLLGAEAAGEEGVEKRIDVISMAIQKDATVFDLEEAEMCYAPQFGSAKDPVNMAGMVAANVIRGDSPVIHWSETDSSHYFILDVREPGEYENTHVAGAVNIPLPLLRSRIAEIPRNKNIAICCAAGQRSYYATRILRLYGFPAANISGGMSSFNLSQGSKGK
jgi:NADPH-dependent 2,4-dienoyl-CoA reductase/sulfur reductase-like enzyme/rhodanese-related sulfurtransferase